MGSKLLLVYLYMYPNMKLCLFWSLHIMKYSSRSSLYYIIYYSNFHFVLMKFMEYDDK